MYESLEQLEGFVGLYLEEYFGYSLKVESLDDLGVSLVNLINHQDEQVDYYVGSFVLYLLY